MEELIVLAIFFIVLAGFILWIVLPLELTYEHIKKYNKSLEIERKKQEWIERACNYLSNIHIGDYAYDDRKNAPVYFDKDGFIDDFRKSMEE